MEEWHDHPLIPGLYPSKHTVLIPQLHAVFQYLYTFYRNTGNVYGWSKEHSFCDQVVKATPFSEKMDFTLFNPVFPRLSDMKAFVEYLWTSCGKVNVSWGLLLWLPLWETILTKYTHFCHYRYSLYAEKKSQAIRCLLNWQLQGTMSSPALPGNRPLTNFLSSSSSSFHQLRKYNTNPEKDNKD